MTTTITRDLPHVLLGTTHKVPAPVIIVRERGTYTPAPRHYVGQHRKADQ